MAHFTPAFFAKVANPAFALPTLRQSEPHGEFMAYVRLGQPGNKNAAMKVIEIHSADRLKVSIRCDQIESVVDDTNVLRIELREYVSEYRFDD